MSFTNKGLAVLAFLTASHIASAQQASNKLPIVVDKNGYAQCPEGSYSDKSSKGEMPTKFANAYWSHRVCGQYEASRPILAKSPKVKPEAAAILLDTNSPLTKCYYDSFPYGREYHKLTPSPESHGRPQVHHGFFVIEEPEWQNIQRAALFACKQKLGLQR